MKPILKWAGGKTALLDQIKLLMPKSFNTYYEPFFGGGAVFFGTDVKEAVLSDINTELMNCYMQVKKHCDQLVPLLDELQKNHSESKYYELRTVFNLRKASGNELDVYDAALMMYLNKAGFNGMYRENRQGNFNIPSGHRSIVTLYDKDNLYCVSSKLQNATILSCDFEEALADAKEGDFVYIDSPYDETFSDYQRNGFSKKDHERLADLCNKLTDKKVLFLLSNSDSNLIRELYASNGYEIKEVKVVRNIRFRGNRKEETELLIKNY